MRQIRLTFKLVSSLGTPFLADTIFGHICWGLRYAEGEEALKQFLACYKQNPPLLVSDGFPAILDTVPPTYYLPFPNLPLGPDCYDKVKADRGILDDDRIAERQFASAWKAVSRHKYIAERALIALRPVFDMGVFMKALFQLKLCPLTMSRRDTTCNCTEWKDCPGLGSGTDDTCCHVARLRRTTDPVTHNVLNRWTSASENLFIQQDEFYNHGFHMFVSLDENVMSLDRFKSCFAYIEHSGFGRDASIGKGAIRDVDIQDVTFPDVPEANAFYNLSSAYVPHAGELGKGWYSTHVKRGKLGAGLVLTNSPWKKPVMMIKAGSVLAGNHEKHYGGLVHGVHYELPDVVQYGYAYVMGVKMNV